MNISVNRAICAGLVLSGILTGCGQPAPPDVAHPDVIRIADGAFLYKSGDQRSLFLISDDGVIVTDPINAEVAVAYRRAIATMTDQPVRFVVYSHYHWDRVAGARIFKNEGAQVIAQAECAQRFRDNPNDEIVMPDITFTDYYEVSLGGQSLELHYFGPSHGDCLTVFLPQPANVLQVVELVNPPRAAFPEDPNVPYIKPHNLRQFFASLQKLAADRGVEQVVASSVVERAGPDGSVPSAPALGPVSIIDEQRRFWDAIYATVERAKAEGSIGIDSFVRLNTIDLTVFEPFDGYREEELPIIMRRFVGFHDMGR